MTVDDESLVAVERTCASRLGHVDPIDGRYHWQGTVFDTLPEGAKLPQQVTLSTGDDHAEARITERPPQGGYSVAGVGAPPFALDDAEYAVPSGNGTRRRIQSTIAKTPPTTPEISSGNRPSAPHRRPAHTPAASTAKPLSALEQTLRAPLLLGSDKRRNPRLPNAIRTSREQPVGSDQHPRRHRVGGQPQPGVADREEDQADSEHCGLAHPIGNQSRRVARQRIYRVVGDVGENHLDNGEANLVEPQQQQRVREVHHGEADQHDSDLPISARQFADTAKIAAREPAARPAASHGRGTPVQRSAPQARPRPRAAERSDGRAIRIRGGRAGGRRRPPTCPLPGESRIPDRARPRRCRRRAVRRAAHHGAPCRVGRPHGLPARPTTPSPRPPSPCPEPPCRSPWRSTGAARSDHRAVPTPAWSARPRLPRPPRLRRRRPRARRARTSGRSAEADRATRWRCPGGTTPRQHPNIAGQPGLAHLRHHAAITAGFDESRPCSRVRPRGPRPRERDRNQTLQGRGGDRFARGPIEILRVGRLRSDGLTRCQISVNSLPANRPPATLVPICSGRYMAFDTALMSPEVPLCAPPKRRTRTRSNIAVCASPTRNP